MKIKKNYMIFSVITLLTIYLLWGALSWTLYKPSDQKGYYDNLVEQQHSLNREDIENQREYTRAIAEGREPSMKYYFEINNSYYYILKDIVYSIEGEKLIELHEKSEGYFTQQDNLYYVYGKEKEKTAMTIAGPVGYTLKNYRYSKLNITNRIDEQIKKVEYERLYFEIITYVNS